MGHIGPIAAVLDVDASGQLHDARLSALPICQGLVGMSFGRLPSKTRRPATDSSTLCAVPVLANAEESDEVGYGRIGFVKLTRQIGTAELLHGEPHSCVHLTLEEGLVLVGRHLDNRRTR